MLRFKTPICSVCLYMAWIVRIYLFWCNNIKYFLYAVHPGYYKYYDHKTNYYIRREQLIFQLYKPRAKTLVSGRSPAEIVGSNPTGGMDVCLLWVLSGRSLCDELITRPEESYRLWCVAVCDLDTSWMRRPWPPGGAVAPNKKPHFHNVHHISYRHQVCLILVIDIMNISNKAMIVILTDCRL